MKLRHITTATLVALATLGANAQDLKQEITVDHEVVPERPDVSRLSLTPEVTLPTMPRHTLDYSTRSVSMTVPATITTLDPTAWADTIYTAPWRGYASIGIMPLFNAGASAGYKFIDNDHTRFSGFLQYNGSVWRGNYPTDDSQKRYFRSHTASVDLNLHQAVGSRSYVEAAADFGFSRYNMPGLGERLVPQNMRRAGLRASWISSTTNVFYSAGFYVNHFAFNNTILDELPDRHIYRPVHENNFGIKGYMRLPLDDKMSSFGVDADFSMVANNRRSQAEFSFETRDYTFLDHPGSYNHGLLTFKPYYRFDYNNFRLNLGARVDFTFNSGKVFHIAPDVLVSWRPSWIFAVFAKAGGGEHQNTLRSLYGVTPYAQTMMAYRNSHIPFTFDLGMTLGSWRGAYLQLGGGYARANDWLMPVTDMSGVTLFKPVNMRGLHWRVEAGYAYRRYGSISVSYEGAPQGYDKGYYLWRDRAKTVVGAHLTVNPIEPITLTVDYELRSGRAMIDLEETKEPEPGFYSVSYSLGRLTNLNIGASYRINDQLTGFIYGTNLLNNKYRHIGLVPGQGLSGLLGVSMKF